jgi:hypothetical protein
VNSADMVTDFKLTEGGRPATVLSLLQALNKFCGSLAEEYNFTAVDRTADIREKYWRLVAFAVEGNSEGYYVHVGAIVRREQIVSHGRTVDCPTAARNGCCPGHPEALLPVYIEFGLAKTYSSESAYAMAKEVSRFLAAAAWN